MAIKNGRMLYRYPGTMLSHYGNEFDYLIVEHEEADAYVAKGWSLTVEKALESATAEPEPDEPAEPEPDEPAEPEPDEPDDDSPPTREELEAQAKKLGIKVDGRYSDRRLLALIAEKMG